MAMAMFGQAPQTAFRTHPALPGHQRHGLRSFPALRTAHDGDLCGRTTREIGSAQTRRTQESATSTADGPRRRFRRAQGSNEAPCNGRKKPVLATPSPTLTRRTPHFTTTAPKQTSPLPLPRRPPHRFDGPPSFSPSSSFQPSIPSFVPSMFLSSFCEAASAPSSPFPQHTHQPTSHVVQGRCPPPPGHVPLRRRLLQAALDGDARPPQALRHVICPGARRVRPEAVIMPPRHGEAVPIGSRAAPGAVGPFPPPRSRMHFAERSHEAGGGSGLGGSRRGRGRKNGNGRKPIPCGADECMRRGSQATAAGLR